GWVGEPAVVHLIQPWFASLPESWGPITAHSVAIGVAFVLITFMHVVFGELIPKSMALQTPESTALLFAKPLNVFARLARPLIILVGGRARRAKTLSGLANSRAVDSGVCRAIDNRVLGLLGYEPASGE